MYEDFNEIQPIADEAHKLSRRKKRKASGFSDIVEEKEISVEVEEVVETPIVEPTPKPTPVPETKPTPKPWKPLIRPRKK